MAKQDNKTKKQTLVYGSDGSVRTMGSVLRGAMTQIHRDHLKRDTNKLKSVNGNALKGKAESSEKPKLAKRTYKSGGKLRSCKCKKK